MEINVAGAYSRVLEKFRVSGDEASDFKYVIAQAPAVHRAREARGVPDSRSAEARGGGH